MGKGSVGLATEMTDIEGVDGSLRRRYGIHDGAGRALPRTGPRMARPCPSGSHQLPSLLYLRVRWLLRSVSIDVRTR